LFFSENAKEFLDFDKLDFLINILAGSIKQL